MSLPAPMLRLLRRVTGWSCPARIVRVDSAASEHAAAGSAGVGASKISPWRLFCPRGNGCCDACPSRDWLLETVRAINLQEYSVGPVGSGPLQHQTDLGQVNAKVPQVGDVDTKTDLPARPNLPCDPNAELRPFFVEVPRGVEYAEHGPDRAQNGSQGVIRHGAHASQPKTAPSTQS